MWRYEILQVKEPHLVVIAQNFAQSLRSVWGSSNLSFMSFGQTSVEICNTSSFEQNLQEVFI